MESLEAMSTPSSTTRTTMTTGTIQHGFQRQLQSGTVTANGITVTSMTAGMTDTILKFVRKIHLGQAARGLRARVLQRRVHQ